MLDARIILHGFGQRFDLSVPLYLYLFAASGVVFLSFVLVVLFAGDQVGEKATAYPRRAVGWLSANRVATNAARLAAEEPFAIQSFY